MSLSDRAIAARSRVNWMTLVGFVGLRHGLVWGIVASALIFTFTCVTQISSWEAHYTMAHVRSSQAVLAGQPNRAFKIKDEFGRTFDVTAFEVQTHPPIIKIANQTKSQIKRYAIAAAIGGVISFLLGFWSVLNGARR